MRSAVVSSLILRTLILLSATCAITLPVTAQVGDSENVPAQTAANSPGREANHHEAGSNESSASLMKDKMFLRLAATDSMEEKMLSELASAKAGSDDVRQLAQSMLAGRKALDERLHTLADSEGVKVPGKLPAAQEADYSKAKALSGEDFDREYLRLMMEQHHRDLRTYRSEAASTANEEIRAFAEQATHTIHDHMVAVDQLGRARGVQGNRPHPQPSGEQPQ